MREHHAFGQPRRPTRVDQRGEVAGVDPVAEFLELVRVLRLPFPPERAEFVEGEEADAIGHTDPAGVAFGEDDRLDLGDPRQPLREGVQHLRVRDEHRLRLRVLRDVDEVILGVGRVERGVDDPGDQAPEVGEREVHIALHEERGVVAPLQADFEQPERDLVSGITEGPVRHRGPSAVRAGLVEAFRVRVALHGFVQEVRERLTEHDLARVRCGCVDLERHGRGGWV